jgi:hypothetical protein
MKQIKYQTSLEHHLHRHHRHHRNGQATWFDRHHHHLRLQDHYHQNRKMYRKRRLLLLNLLKSNPNKAQLAQLEKVLQMQ